MIDTQCISGPKAYQTIIKKFQQYYNMAPDQYTKQHAEEFIALHAPTLTKASHRWYAASLNYHYRYHLNISLKLKVPYQPLPVPKIHTLKEVKEFFDQLPQQYKNIFRLIYGYGLKISEALNLSISHIDLNNGLILLSKGRQIKLSKIAYDHIEKHIQNRKRQFLNDQSKKQTYRNNSFRKLLISFEKQPLFASRKKTSTDNRVIRPKITPSTVHAIVRNINKKLQPHKSITTMSLRHSFAIEVLHKGTTIIQLMKILGHTNIKQTLQYEKLYRSPKVTSPADNLYPLTKEQFTNNLTRQITQPGIPAYQNILNSIQKQKIQQIYKTNSPQAFQQWRSKAQVKNQNYCNFNEYNQQEYDYIFLELPKNPAKALKQILQALKYAKKGLMLHFPKNLI